VVSNSNHRAAGAGPGAGSRSFAAGRGRPEQHRSIVSRCPGKLAFFLSLLLWSATARAEDCRYGHGNAEVKATNPTRGCLGRGCVLIDKEERWVLKLPWVVQDELFKPTSIVLPELPLEDGCDSCLVYWDVYVPVAAQAVWHVRYAGELRREKGVWRIRYYSTATLHSVTA
jgi:hypothetical protein